MGVIGASQKRQGFVAVALVRVRSERLFLSFDQTGNKRNATLGTTFFGEGWRVTKNWGIKVYRPKLVAADVPERLGLYGSSSAASFVFLVSEWE